MSCCKNEKKCCGIGYKSIPAALGDDTGEFKPENGAYHNMLIRYEANGALYFYTNDGIFTQLDGERFFTYIDELFDNIDLQSEVDQKLNEMAQDGSLEAIMAEYAATKVDYFHFSTSSPFSDIAAAFAGNQPKVIVFDPGTYNMSSHIILGSNTKVDLNGATISRNNTSNMIFGYPLNTTVTGFSGVHNIEFSNGTLDVSLALMHNVNFVFSNVTFGPHLATHAAQIAASKNVSFIGCVFKGRTISASVNPAQEETLQIECATRSGQPWLIDASSPSYDNGGNENILVDGCVFESGDGVNYGIYAGIGHHSDNGVTPYAVKNITIKNCTFGNTLYAPLTPTCWDGYEISRNTFTYTGSADDMIIIRHRWGSRNGVIKDNVFNGGKIAVSNVNVAACSKLIIEGNDISMTVASGHGINMTGWSDVVIRNNIFRSAASNYINAYATNNIAPTNIIISENTFNVGYSNTSSSIILLSAGNNVTVSNNTSYQQTHSQYLVSLGDSYGNTLKYMGNTIISPDASVRTVYVPSTYPSPESLYGFPIAVFSGGSGYSQITNQTPTYPLNKFNNLVLLIHKSGNAIIKDEYVICPWTFGKRFEDARAFYVSLPDTDGTMMLGVFTINGDGTFSYSSPTSNLTLRAVRAFNTNFYNN